ncbi:hypothetical protein JCM11251_001230 [Rhodosporidiobolus azoricus]
MSSFIPSTLKTSTAPASTDQPPPPPSSFLPPAAYTDCQTCRITGTLTFLGVGGYAMTVGRATQKTQVGKGVASLVGMGFLLLAAGRWTAYTPPPVEPQQVRAV